MAEMTDTQVEAMGFTQEASIGAPSMGTATMEHEQATGHKVLSFFWDARCRGCEVKWTRTFTGEPFNPNKASQFFYREEPAHA
ncbi:hypothetical protein LCGC14_0745240 [marine sediment metagenome]|uniref:Uncharacterized protein n=1 Tax=marine sediment metagenome TaxID=412755 RepID=A0A0F9SQI9_9ZZZZ